MKVDAIDPHHRELQANRYVIGYGHVAYAPSAIYLLNSVFLRRTASNRGFAHKWRMSDAIICYDYRLEAPGDADLVHHVSFIHWSLNVH